MQVVPVRTATYTIELSSIWAIQKYVSVLCLQTQLLKKSLGLQEPTPHIVGWVAHSVYQALRLKIFVVMWRCV